MFFPPHCRCTASQLYDQRLNSRPYSTRYNRPNNPVPSVLKRRNASRSRPRKRDSTPSSRYASHPHLAPSVCFRLHGRARNVLLSRQGAKLEIDSILRETCDRVLNDPAISRNTAVLRAAALQILGDTFMAVRNERDEARDDGEYVRIETKSSRQRAQSRVTPGGQQ
jgi:hypothetical protein